MPSNLKQMTMNPTADEYRTLLRFDLYAFTMRCFVELNPTTKFMPNWHLEVIASALESCRRGEINRLIVNEPPRSLKSHCVSVAFVAYLLGHNPSAQILCISYGQELSNKHALDCRTIMTSAWYQRLFPRARLSSQRQAVPEFITTQNGFRLSSSIGGVLTGRGADFIIIDDPLKPEEALSDTQRKAVNDAYDHTVYSRLNNKTSGCIILVMQRLHEDDLVGHVLEMEPWKLIRFPAIAEKDETHLIQTPYGIRPFERRAGEVLHVDREPIEVLNRLRETLGEYHFAGQYQQAPAPLGGGLVKVGWFKRYTTENFPENFEMIVQSWDTANKPSELANFTVCTTWGIRNKNLYLVHVFRKRLDYPALKRAVREQAEAFRPQTILIEDKSSGTQLIQELTSDGMYEIKAYIPTMDKIMRMSSVTSTIENGFVHLPEKTEWLAEYVHELTSFPKAKYDDQADSTSQALDWIKQNSMNSRLGWIEYLQQESQKAKSSGAPISGSAPGKSSTIPDSMPCAGCNGVMSQPIPGGLRCMQCGAQHLFSTPLRNAPRLTRAEALNRYDLVNGDIGALIEEYKRRSGSLR
jgi:predicted phage terminase large subunit-like protein